MHAQKQQLTMQVYLNKTDDELAILLMAHDTKALSTLYFRHVKAVYYFVLGMAKSPTLTEDIVQETFIRFWQNRHLIEPSKNIKAYLLTIARHHLLNLLKRAQHENFILQELKHYSNPIEQTTEQWMDYRESNYLLQEALERLPNQQREVFKLCKLEGLSYKQVAQRFGITEGTVNSHMVKALKYIKQFIVLHQLLWLLLLTGCYPF